MTSIESEYNGPWEGWSTKHVYQVAVTIDNDYECYTAVRNIYLTTRDDVMFRVRLANYLSDKHLNQIEFNEIYRHYVSKFSEIKGRKS